MSKKKTTLVVALVVMGVAALGLAAAVYAKYVTTLTGNTADLTVAKWAFDTDNQSGVVNCPVTPWPYDTDEVQAGKIAPGTEGSCTITISNANSEVGVNYTIKLSADDNQPTYLEFYSDAAHKNKLTAEGISGSLPAKAANTDTKTIYWYWPYENGDDATDTSEGEAAKTTTITFDITGTQVQP